jgi:hypothetical protein
VLDQGEQAAGGKLFVRGVVADLDHGPITLLGRIGVPAIQRNPPNLPALRRYSLQRTVL